MKLREDRDRMADDWSEEYATRAFSAKRSGAGLGALRAEYVHRYNQLLEREKQPHSDFFVNLSEDFKDELDFNEIDWLICLSMINTLNGMRQSI